MIALGLVATSGPRELKRNKTSRRKLGWHDRRAQAYTPSQLHHASGDCRRPREGPAALFPLYDSGTVGASSGRQSA